MQDEKPEGQRRTYILPNELHDRILKFQEEKGYTSEVEAVRRLLDEALKSRDDAHTIIDRFVDRLKSNPIPHEVAKDVLVGHPLVISIGFQGDDITFEIKGASHRYLIDPKGNVFTSSGFGGDGWEPYGKGPMDGEIPF